MKVLIRIIIISSLMLTVLSAQTKDDEASITSDAMSYVGMGRTFKPFIEAQYGLSWPRHELFDDSLTLNGIATFQLGYSELINHKNYVLKMDERFIFGTYQNTDLNYITNDTGRVNLETTQFGVSYRTGFGYKIGPLNLIPYQETGFVWSQINSDRPTDLSLNDATILDRYEGTYRFGMNMGGGLKVSFLGTLSATASYNYSVVYPRHIVLPWLGSFAIQTIGLGAVSVFGEDIVNSSSLLGPLFYFVLKNGLGILFYNGMKEKMNWPFDSETPMTFETYRIGFGIDF